MIEIGVLAATVVSTFLVPLVKEGAEQLRTKLLDKASEETAGGLVDTAKALWDKVRGKSEGSDAKVVELFEEQPDTMSTALEQVIKRQLEADPAFRQEIARLVEAQEGGSTRWQLMGEYVAAVDARNARLSDNASIVGMQVGSNPPHNTKDDPEGR